MSSTEMLLAIFVVAAMAALVIWHVQSRFPAAIEKLRKPAAVLASFVLVGTSIASLLLHNASPRALEQEATPVVSQIETREPPLRPPTSATSTNERAEEAVVALHAEDWWNGLAPSERVLVNLLIDTVLTAPESALTSTCGDEVVVDQHHVTPGTAPPMARARVAGGAVYLLAWVERPDGPRGRIMWLSADGPQTLRWKVAEVPPTDLSKLTGQQYEGVPCERVITPKDKAPPRHREP